MNKLSFYLRPLYLLCLLGVAHCTHAHKTAPWATFAKGLATSKAPLLQRPASAVGTPQPNATASRLLATK